MNRHSVKDRDAMVNSEALQESPPVVNSNSMQDKLGLVNSERLKASTEMVNSDGMQDNTRLVNNDKVTVMNRDDMDNGASMVNSEPMQDSMPLVKSPLRNLHDTANSIEKLRIQMGNRVSAITRGVDDVNRPIPKVYADLQALMEQLEHTADKGIEEELKQWPVYNYWLRHVKGIGPGLAGQMLALLLPPIPTKGPSSWKKAAGLYPEMQPDGLWRLPRARAGGGKITYHPWLRRCLYNVATSFVRNGGYYRTMYEMYKMQMVTRHAARPYAFCKAWEHAGGGRQWVEAHAGIVYEDKDSFFPLKQKDEWFSIPTMAKAMEIVGSDPNWPLHRIESVTRWKMVELFLSHLWEMWCEAEGIHNRGPYGLTTLADGTQVIRLFQQDGSYVDHAYMPAPRFEGKGKI